MAEPPQLLVPINSMTCMDCGQEYPATEMAFRVDPSGKNGMSCRLCRAYIAGQQKGEERAAKELVVGTRRAIAGMASVLADIRGTDASDVWEGLIRQLHGVEVFCQLYAAQLLQACANDPGSQRVLRALEGITRLGVQISAQRKEAAGDLEKLSDEDLERRMRAIMTEQPLRLAQEDSDVKAG